MPHGQEHAGRTAVLLVAVVLATAACGGGAAAGGPPEQEVSPTDHATVDRRPDSTALGCGQRFGPPAGGGLLTLTGRFPATVLAGARAVAGTVEVTSRAAVRGVVMPRADVFL